jgi:hypothetical protein
MHSPCMRARQGERRARLAGVRAAGLAETAANLRTMVSTFKLETKVADDRAAGAPVTARRWTAGWKRSTLAVAGRTAR